MLSVYGWAALSFGIRFSNLTHRGIITSGPYRFTKHPAYVAKNISWWLISIPFLPADGSPFTALQLCLGLAGINSSTCSAPERRSGTFHRIRSIANTRPISANTASSAGCRAGLGRGGLPQTKRADPRAALFRQH